MIRRPPRSTLFPYTTLSDLARRELVAVGVEDPHLTEDGAPDRAPVLEPFVAGDEGDRLRLGPAVELEDPVTAEPLDPGLLEPHGTRGRHVEQHEQTRQVVPLALGLGQAPDAVH